MLATTRNRSGLPELRMFPMNRMLDRFFNDEGFFTPWNGAEGIASIPVAMWEDESHVHVQADAPGMSGDDIDVSVQDGVLSIRGERKCERTGEGHDTRCYGRFEQHISLSSAVRADQVDAKLTNGVLNLTFPKSEEAKRQKITVKSE